MSGLYGNKIMHINEIIAKLQPKSNKKGRGGLSKSSPLGQKKLKIFLISIIQSDFVFMAVGGAQFTKYNQSNQRTAFATVCCELDFFGYATFNFANAKQCTVI